MIARFLSANWPWLLGLLTSLALGITLLITQAQLGEARADLRAEKVLTASLSKDIEQQNDSIQQWKDAAGQNREVYLAGLAAANRKAVRLEINAADYLNMSVPSDPQEACEVADRILEEVTR